MNAGFTTLELLVVLFVLALLFAIPFVDRSGVERARLQSALVKAKAISDAAFHAELFSPTLVGSDESKVLSGGSAPWGGEFHTVLIAVPRTQTFTVFFSPIPVNRDLPDHYSVLSKRHPELQAEEGLTPVVVPASVTNSRSRASVNKRILYRESVW